MSKHSKFLTVSEVANELRVTPKAVRDWIEEGKLLALQLGGERGRYRIPRSAYVEFLADAETGKRPAKEAIQ